MDSHYLNLPDDAGRPVDIEKPKSGVLIQLDKEDGKIVKASVVSFNPVRIVMRALSAELGRNATIRDLAALWRVSHEALYQFERQGYLPPDRARAAADRWGLVFEDLIKQEA